MTYFPGLGSLEDLMQETKHSMDRLRRDPVSVDEDSCQTNAVQLYGELGMLAGHLKGMADAAGDELTAAFDMGDAHWDNYPLEGGVSKSVIHAATLDTYPQIVGALKVVTGAERVTIGTLLGHGKHAREILVAAGQNAMASEIDDLIMRWKL
jgi:hypothetical protein